MYALLVILVSCAKQSLLESGNGTCVERKDSNSACCLCCTCQSGIFLSAAACLRFAHNAPQVVNKLGLSYTTTKELNHIIDNALPGRPAFEYRELNIGGETLELYFRDILSCIRSIYGDPELAQDLIVAPERHYIDIERKDRIYSEMHTGDWWWAVQVRNTILYPE
jgi:Plavaka transposase